MSSPTTVLFALIFLAMLSAGGLAYALLFRRIRSDDKVEQRMARFHLKAAPTSEATRQNDPARRRRAVQDSLRELEIKEKARARQTRSPPLILRMQQAGLSWSRRTFILISVGGGLLTALVALMLGLPLYAVAAAAIAGGLGLPRWIIGYMRARRFKRFLNYLPSAVDVIVRGIKAGLPIGDCLRIIATEAQEPVKTEFRIIVEQQQGLGMPLADAVARLPERIPLAEASFFAIVIAIQQKSGGNLSEALGNLSHVLRERHKMKEKIKAMSMEAKASGGIIGSLPVIVSALTSLSSPQYIGILFTDPIGHVILVGAALWMGTGILVMKKMISFKF